MKKEELVAFVSESANITKKSTGESVNAVLEGITSALEKGDSISLTSFGSFKVVKRAAREGRSPSTGQNAHPNFIPLPSFLSLFRAAPSLFLLTIYYSMVYFY